MRSEVAAASSVTMMNWMMTEPALTVAVTASQTTPATTAMAHSMPDNFAAS